jgi:putative ABC transport system permease protein
MFRLTIKNLNANRVRLGLTTFAVVLAVSFVVASFVLTDGLRSSFGDLSSEIVAGTDLELRPVGGFGEADLVPTDTLADVAAIDGVGAAAGRVEAMDTIQPVNAEGEPVTTAGPPLLAHGWVDDARLSQFTVTEGSAPGPGQFTMDIDTAANNGFTVGQTYDIITPTGRTELTLVGLTTFGEANDTLGAALIQFDGDELQTLIGEDGYESIAVALASGADKVAVEQALAATLPGAEVVDNATLESETRADFNEGIDIIGNILLIFAGVSLFVSIFIIYNTFSIVLGQRTKELALLRTVGADPVQLRRSVKLEALVIGTLASAVGILAGVGVALGLRALFGAIGADLPDSPIIISGRTIALAAAVGIGVTFLSSIGPARKASRVPPVAALRDGVDAGSVSGRVRTVVGLLAMALGLAQLALGLFVASGRTLVIALMAVGSIGFFVGVTLLSPLVAQPLTRAMGWPLEKAFGTSGALAHQNAGRNPQRTATTAAALMIGLALVTMTLTVGESGKAQLRSTLDSSVQADYLAITEGEDARPFSRDLTTALAASPVTDELTSFRYTRVAVDGGIRWVMGTDLAATDALFDLGVDEGRGYDPAVRDAMMVSNEEAEAAGISVGDVIPLTFESGQSRDMTVIGIYNDDIVTEDPFVIDFSTWDAVGGPTNDNWIALSLVEGVTETEADAAFAPVAADYPQISITTANDYVERIEAEIDQILAGVNVMVALAVIIALIGIANTLALSVFERTRELGLLRAVGMSRRQLRRMVRLEAALVALFGAALGVAIGIGFGWAAVMALPATITSTLAVPVTRIVILVAVAGVAGLLAAWGPARRAAKLDVLSAISS